MLARTLERVPAALRPLGLDERDVDVAEGDVLDGEAVDRAMRHADALLHAGNVYSLNSADAERMYRVNIDGTRQVLKAAVKRRLDPIVHVSSTLALLPSRRLTAASPVGHPRGPYLESKAAAERIARDLQSRGAPVVVTNPAAVYGPHQPHLGESATLVRNILRRKPRLVAPGGFGIVDVREIATAHARLFTPGLGPRRYLLAGRWVAYGDLVRLIAEVTGRRLPTIRIPLRLALASGHLADIAQRRGIDPGFSYAAIWTLANHPDFDDGEARRALGLEWRPLEETLRDTIAWLHDQGHVSIEEAGRVAGTDWRITGEAPTGGC